MSFKILGVSIKISYLLIVMLALFSFFDKSGLIILAIITALMHESGHIIAATLCNCEIKELAFMPFGIRMILSSPLSLLKMKKKIVILSAGCLLNFLTAIILFVFEKNISEFCLLHLIVGFFNLLPIGTLDGGRILAEIIYFDKNPDFSYKICNIVSFISSLFLLIIGAIILFNSKYNISLFLTAIYLSISVIKRQKKLN